MPSFLRLLLSPDAFRALLTPALLTILAFQVVSGILVGPLLSLFPVYVEKELGLSSVFSANIRVLSVCCGGLVALFGGAVSDSLGRKPAYLLAMTAVLASGLLFLIKTPVLLYPTAIYTGLMFGLGTVAGLSYIMDVAPRQALGLATASYFMTGTFGNALGSALSGWVANEIPNGYTWLGYGVTGGQLLCMLLAAWLLPVLPQAAGPKESTSSLGSYREMLIRRDIWLLLLLRALPTVYWGVATLVMPLILFRLTGSDKVAGYYASANMILSAVCQAAMGRMVDRVGPRGPVVLCIVLITVATLGQGLLSHSVPGLITFGLLGAGAAWALSIAMTTLVQALSDEQNKAKLLGLTHVAWSIGFLGGTLLGGYLAREAGRGGVAFLIAGGCGIVATLCAVQLVGYLRKQPETG